MLAILPVLALAVNYQPYQGRAVSAPVYQSSSAVGTVAAVPGIGFHSTSAFSSQWENTTTTPMLNADGTVNNEAYGVGQRNAPGARKAPSAPGTPTGDLSTDTQQPLGDALLPLMLCALAYAIYRMSRKRAREV